MKNICVFCGANFGCHLDYEDAAREFGRELAGNGMRLIYGGAKVGLMGVLADEALAAGGEVLGVMPKFLAEREVAHPDIQMEWVDSMHTRKTRMAELADAFVVLPGGFGTMEEFFEILTWAQLGMHQKPIALLDIRQFFQPLILFLRHCAGQGFIRHEQLSMLQHAQDAADVLPRLAAYRPVDVTRWLEAAKS